MRLTTEYRTLFSDCQAYYRTWATRSPCPAPDYGGVARAWKVAYISNTYSKYSVASLKRRF